MVLCRGTLTPKQNIQGNGSIHQYKTVALSPEIPLLLKPMN